MARKKSDSSASAGGADTAPAKPYVVLARKYRPQTFDDLIGQDAMVTTLRNAFATGRIAQGYMLTGVRGVGKTTTARILARAFNYERPDAAPEAQGPTVDMAVPGRHCAEIMEGRHPDVIEMDAASNTGVDDVREIIENARYRPILARTKVFIIDEVHMLSRNAFNALLKTLEEPPEHVRFIFATTEIRKVPVTVLSRCQRFDLRRVEVVKLMEHFRRIAAAEGAAADDEGLRRIARAAEGSVRDGLSLLDQAIAMGSGAVTTAGVRAMLGLADRARVFDLLERLYAGAAGEALGELAALCRDGADPLQVLTDLADAVHAVTRAKITGSAGAGEELSEEERRRATGISSGVSLALLSRTWQMLVKGLEEAGKAPDARAAAEMVLVRIAYASDLPSPDEVIRLLGGEPTTLRGTRRADAELQTATPTSAPTASSESFPALSAVSDSRPAPTAEEMASSMDDRADDPFGGLPLAFEEEARGSVAPAVSPRSFEEVVRLAGQRRDAKLKVHLEEHVSLIRFDPAGSLELHLLPGAPKEIGNELREKLNAWTGMRWTVALGRSPGQLPLGEAERRRLAAEVEELKKHPAVAAVLAEFPGAEIKTVHDLPRRERDETGTG